MNSKAKLVAIILTVTAMTLSAQRSMKNYPAVQGNKSALRFEFPHTNKGAGQRDPDATAILAQFEALSKREAGATLCVMGTMSVGNNETNVSSAHLTIGSGKNQQRLDFSGPAGETSVRFDGQTAGVFKNDHLESSLPFSAANAGLFVTPDTVTLALTNNLTSVADDGVTQVNGQRLHRITVSTPLLNSGSRSRLIPPRIFDLYFDPASNLLKYAVDSVSLSASSPTAHLRVITYGDYKQEGAGEWPHSLSEIRDGQLLWTLEISSVDLTCKKDAQYFSARGGVQ